MSDVTLKTFPRNKSQALTMLYLSNQDLSGLTPSQILEEYNKAQNEIESAIDKERAEDFKKSHEAVNRFFR